MISILPERFALSPGRAAASARPSRAGSARMHGARGGALPQRPRRSRAGRGGRSERSGGKALLVQGDVAEPGTVDRLIAETVAGFGRLDILINNAGDQISRVDIAETSDELFDRHVAVNIRPTFAACRAAVRQFRKQGNGRQHHQRELDRRAHRRRRWVVHLRGREGIHLDVLARARQGGRDRRAFA